MKQLSMNTDHSQRPTDWSNFQRDPSPTFSAKSIPFFMHGIELAFGLRARQKGARVASFSSRNRLCVSPRKTAGTRGCATMFLAERLELDVENRGNRLIAWIGALLQPG